MSADEYVLVLWRVIGAMGLIIAALGGALWRHIDRDNERARTLEKCKDALGIKDE